MLRTTCILGFLVVCLELIGVYFTNVNNKRKIIRINLKSCMSLYLKIADATSDDTRMNLKSSMLLYLKITDGSRVL